MSRINGKIAASGIVAFLVGAIGYTTVYLPHYSQLARDRQERLSQQPPQTRTNQKGSMWSNIDKQIKEKKSD